MIVSVPTATIPFLALVTIKAKLVKGCGKMYPHMYPLPKTVSTRRTETPPTTTTTTTTFSTRMVIMRITMMVLLMITMVPVRIVVVMA